MAPTKKRIANDSVVGLIEEGLPCVIVQPGGVYGPDDHSALGSQIEQFLAGRMPMIAFPDLGMNLVYVDDATAFDDEVTEFFAPHADGQDYMFVTVFGERRTARSHRP